MSMSDVFWFVVIGGLAITALVFTRRLSFVTEKRSAKDPEQLADGASFAPHFEKLDDNRVRHITPTKLADNATTNVPTSNQKART